MPNPNKPIVPIELPEESVAERLHGVNEPAAYLEALYDVAAPIATVLDTVAGNLRVKRHQTLVSWAAQLAIDVASVADWPETVNTLEKLHTAARAVYCYAEQRPPKWAPNTFTYMRKMGCIRKALRSEQQFSRMREGAD